MLNGEVAMASKDWIERATGLLLRISLAIVFGWFGAMKLFEACPLGEFISRTLPFLPSRIFLLSLGCWEVAIGFCLLVPPLVRIGLVLLLVHLPGTVLPLIVLPSECFAEFPFGLTLAGQYIVKNLVLGSAALLLLTRSWKPVAARRRRPDPVVRPSRAVSSRAVPRRGIPVASAAAPSRKY